MGIFFSKKKAPSRVTEQDKAVLQLKQTRDKLKLYQKRIEQSIEKDREIAKKLVKKGQKERALLLLRKKKFQEQVLAKSDGQLENLERLVHDIEFSQVETKVLEGLKIGNETLKKIHEVLSIDEIEKVMDETREGIEKQQEIDDLLSGALTVEDEDEAEAELEALMEKDAESPEITLPEVPSTELEEITKKEKDISKKEQQEPVALEA